MQGRPSLLVRGVNILTPVQRGARLGNAGAAPEIFLVRVIQCWCRSSGVGVAVAAGVAPASAGPGSGAGDLLRKRRWVLPNLRTGMQRLALLSKALQQVSPRTPRVRALELTGLPLESPLQQEQLRWVSPATRTIGSLLPAT